MTTLDAAITEALASAEDAKSASTTNTMVVDFEEGSAPVSEEVEYTDPFRGTLAGAPLVTPPPLPAEDPRFPGTRTVPVSPAESGVRNAPSMAALASEAALRAASEPNRAATAPAAEVVQFATTTPRLERELEQSEQLELLREGAREIKRSHWWSRAFGLIAALLLALGIVIATHRAQLQGELVTAQGVVTSLQVEISQAKARINALSSALTAEQGKPWWKRLNVWW